MVLVNATDGLRDAVSSPTGGVVGAVAVAHIILMVRRKVTILAAQVSVSTIVAFRVGILVPAADEGEVWALAGARFRDRALYESATRWTADGARGLDTSRDCGSPEG